MWIVITGGAGYIGSELVSKLLRLNKKVIVIDNLIRGEFKHLRTFIRNHRMKFISCDIADKKALFSHMNDVEINSIIHLAAVPGLERCQKNPQRAILTNVIGTHNLLELSQRHNVKKFIFGSSGAVYGHPITFPISEDAMLNPSNLYGITKATCEKLVSAHYLDYGIESIILRFSNIYGVGQFTYYENVIPKFVKQAYNWNDITVFGDGAQSRDFIHIDDVTRAILLMLHDSRSLGCEVFNVGSGKPTSINTIASIICQIMKNRFGIEIKYDYIPARKGESYDSNYCYNIIKINNFLGFKTHWSIKQGIKQIFKDIISNAG